MKLSKFLERDLRKNINNFLELKKAIQKAKPTIVFHMAAQSSVLVSYKSPDDTVETNIIGTYNILKAIKSCKSLNLVLL